MPTPVESLPVGSPAWWLSRLHKRLVERRPGLEALEAWYAPLDTSRTGTGRLRFLAVRGQMTADLLGLGQDVPRGDPGTLVPEFWGRTPVRHRLGVVPHYVDDRSFGWADLVIDVSAPVDEVIAQITSCAAIATSSLHGLIVAQAYGIPAVRLPHPRVAGGDFKWLDHLTGTAAPDDLIGALP